MEYCSEQRAAVWEDWLQRTLQDATESQHSEMRNQQPKRGTQKNYAFALLDDNDANDANEEGEEGRQQHQAAAQGVGRQSMAPPNELALLAVGPSVLQPVLHARCAAQ